MSSLNRAFGEGPDPAAAAELRAALTALVDVRGVRNAAVMGADGRMVQGVERGAGLERVAELATSALASAEALSGVLGDGPPRQTLVEYDDGPVLLASLGGAGSVTEGCVAVLTLTSVADLGRVRFQLRRLLPGVTQALAAWLDVPDGEGAAPA